MSLFSERGNFLLQHSSLPEYLTKDESEETLIKQEMRDNFDRYNLNQISNSREIFGEEILSPFLKKQEFEPHVANILYPISYSSPFGNNNSNENSSQSVSIKLEGNMNSSNNIPFNLNSQSNPSAFSLLNNTPLKISTNLTPSTYKYHPSTPLNGNYNTLGLGSNPRSFARELTVFHHYQASQGTYKPSGENVDFNRIFLKKELSPQITSNFLYQQDEVRPFSHHQNHQSINNNSASNTPIYTLDPKNEYIEYEQPPLGMMFGVKNCDRILNFDKYFSDEDPSQVTPEKTNGLGFEATTPKKNHFFESPTDPKEIISSKTLNQIANYNTDERTTEKRRVKRELRRFPERITSGKREREESVKVSENSHFNDFEDTPARSSRGLRVLSLRVKEIVCEIRDTTYKEVADKLILDLETKEFGGFRKSDNPKEEQNIKRRVYDALNVLIAADVLKKKGKKVFSDDPSLVSGGNMLAINLKDRKKSKEELLKKRETVSAKRETLKEMILKYFALFNLLSRNKLVISETKVAPGKDPCEGTQTKEDMKKKKRDPKSLDNQEIQGLIHFPFIVLGVHPGETLFSSSSDKTIVKVISKRAFSILGDVDILLKLNFQRMNLRENFEKLLPKEIHKIFTLDYLRK